jgi:(S)-mandelate dehydrogenase
MRLSRAQNIADLRLVARRRLPRVVFDYIDGAVEDERGMAHNRAAFERVRIVPRYLVDIGTRDLSTTLFGRRYALPFGIGPTGLSNLAWPGGADSALARTAAAADVPFVLSTAGTTSIEAISQVAPEHCWFQLYMPKEEGAREDLVRRADAAGAHALMVTVDVPVSAKRERDLRNGFMLPLRPSVGLALDGATHPGWALQLLRHGMPNFENLKPYSKPGAKVATLAGYISSQLTGSVSWEMIDGIRKAWKKPLLIKGIQSVADALLAVEHGVDGIVISNHGGRQLDAAPAPIEVLPAIRAAVGDKLVLCLDSGVRRGPDIAKALALGADYVFLGRATLYGAAAAGQTGATKAVDFLRDELDRCLAQIGCPTVAGLRDVDVSFDTAWADPVAAASV